MNESMKEGGGFVKSDGDSDKKPTSDAAVKSHKTVLPVNTAMMAKLIHPALGLVLHRHKYANVTIVGSVTSFVDKANVQDFRLTDSTGPALHVQQWKGEEDGSSQSSESRAASLADNALVRVHGHPRKTAGEPLLLASKVELVTDVNEPAMHFLDVANSNLVLKKRKNNISAGLPDVTGFPGSQPVDANASFNASFTNTMSFNNLTAGTAGDARSSQHSQPKVTQSPKDLVLKAISKDSSVQGMSLIELESKLKSLNLKIIKEAIEFLLTEGHIYTTTDDNHFKSLDA